MRPSTRVGDVLFTLSPCPSWVNGQGRYDSVYTGERILFFFVLRVRGVRPGERLDRIQDKWQDDFG